MFSMQIVASFRSKYLYWFVRFLRRNSKSHLQRINAQCSMFNGRTWLLMVFLSFVFAFEENCIRWTCIHINWLEILKFHANFIKKCILAIGLLLILNEKYFPSLRFGNKMHSLHACVCDYVMVICSTLTMKNCNAIKTRNG